MSLFSFGKRKRIAVDKGPETLIAESISRIANADNQLGSNCKSSDIFSFFQELSGSSECYINFSFGDSTVPDLVIAAPQTEEASVNLEILASYSTSLRSATLPGSLEFAGFGKKLEDRQSLSWLLLDHTVYRVYRPGISALWIFIKPGHKPSDGNIPEGGMRVERPQDIFFPSCLFGSIKTQDVNLRYSAQRILLTKQIAKSHTSVFELSSAGRADDGAGKASLAFFGLESGELSGAELRAIVATLSRELLKEIAGIASIRPREPRVRKMGFDEISRDIGISCRFELSLATKRSSSLFYMYVPLLTLDPVFRPHLGTETAKGLNQNPLSQLMALNLAMLHRVLEKKSLFRALVPANPGILVGEFLDELSDHDASTLLQNFLIPRAPQGSLARLFYYRQLIASLPDEKAAPILAIAKFDAQRLYELMPSFYRDEYVEYAQSIRFTREECLGFNDEALRELAVAIGRLSLGSRVKWILDSALRPRIEAEDRKRLDMLKQSGVPLSSVSALNDKEAMGFFAIVDDKLLARAFSEESDKALPLLRNKVSSARLAAITSEFAFVKKSIERGELSLASLCEARIELDLKAKEYKENREKAGS